MDKDAIAQQITDFLQSVTADHSLTPTTGLIETGIVDSLTMMDLVSFVEGQYDFRLNVDEFTPSNFATAQTLADLVERKVSVDAHRRAA